ncbi:acyl-CoA thioesterase [Fictibacillus nanhaiensis]|uniref:acyl-CoA thioesterase n=1 Tax=Fictibacillus nanhaiensis TaxID=742169 RepID=UPI001C94E841|nr:thioesterase family protein [Fictibacillus nanhaiensis]MBY6035271.1 acyl-CoA thioesterase [Fictibacillus nanhaiensis]
MARQDYILDLDEWKAGFHFFHELHVRFGEIDGFGHVNNTNVFVYMEEARIALFKELDLMKSWGAQDATEIPVVADLQCDYLSQIRYDEKLTIFVKMNEVGSSSIDLHYLGLNKEKLPVFTGRGAIVQISKQTGRPSKWSEDLKMAFSNFSQKAFI